MSQTVNTSALNQMENDPPQNQWIGFIVEGITESGTQYQAHKFGYFIDGHFYAYAGGRECVRLSTSEQVVSWTLLPTNKV